MLNGTTSGARLRTVLSYPDMEHDEYEYQYDATDTSTFLVELDLSTLNGIKRDMPRKQYNKRRKKAGLGDDEDDEDRDDNVEEDDDVDEAMAGAAEARQKPDKGNLQVLDFDSLNPIVAYKGNFHSCTWHDMIGTNMFYSLPHQGIAHLPLRSTREYSLLGTSRVKLIGQRAKVSERASARKRQRIGDEPLSSQQESPGPGQSDNEPRHAKVDSARQEIQEQTSFLEKLMEIQRSRQATSSGTSLVDHRASADALEPTIEQHYQSQNLGERAVS